jgi:hypothetical protein
MNTTNNFYLNEEFKAVIEDHLELLKNSDTNVYCEITPNEAYRFEYDFYGLLRHKGIDYRFHWIVLRMNDRISPYASCKDLTMIIVPSSTQINDILEYERTQSI